MEALFQERIDQTSTPLSLELIDRSTFEAIERLAAAGILQLTAEGRRLLHQSPIQEKDEERERRLARAREAFGNADRKLRMAAVLASGGFPVEALPSLREGVELGLRSRAGLEEIDLLDTEEVPAAWIEHHLPAYLPLIAKLRSGPEALLGAGGDEVRGWIEEGGRLASRLREELGIGAPG